MRRSERWGDPRAERDVAAKLIDWAKPGLAAYRIRIAVPGWRKALDALALAYTDRLDSYLT